jgi:hypothetical protein
MTTIDIALRLTEILDNLKDLDPIISDFIENALLPTLEGIIDKNLSFATIIALGEETTIQDWIHTSNPSLIYESVGRLQAVANLLASCAIHSEQGEANSEEDEPDCDTCLRSDCAHNPKENKN